MVLTFELTQESAIAALSKNLYILSVGANRWSRSAKGKMAVRDGAGEKNIQDN